MRRRFARETGQMTFHTIKPPGFFWARRLFSLRRVKSRQMWLHVRGKADNLFRYEGLDGALGGITGLQS